jgi:ribonuclease E
VGDGLAGEMNMAKRMLVDATHVEETRVATVDGHRLDDLDFEIANRKMLKGNIYLAKVIRIEPSLQAAFVEYGGNRHGFLAFSEIHPDYYRIPVGDRPEDSLHEDDDDLSDAPIITEGPGKQHYTSDEVDTHSHEDKIADGNHGLPQPTWSDEPGSGSVSDLIPGFALETSNHSLVRDFSQPVQAATILLTEPNENALADAPVAVMPVPTQSVEGIDSDAAVSIDNVTDISPAALQPHDSATAETPVGEVLSETGFETIGGEASDTAPERFVRPRRPNYKIQEVIKRRQVMLIQVVKEERGNKGAALTTYLSLAGRYCVLMPNTAHGGGVSRKITNHQDRRRMKEILDQLEVPDGMALILRTAGMEQEIADIQRDLDYLLRLWNNIREQTLQSSAPALIYEEANLIKRALRDLYTKDVTEILVAGRTGYENARDFMQMLIPDAVNQIKLYEDTTIPLFFRYQVEEQVDALHSPIVQLRSGGYLVINPTEALVAIDVNSGRATRERHIEETALKTNLEAAEEIGRQLRLRDFAGLIVIDFIDMEDGRNNAAVERRIKESMRSDRARLQIGRISHFGLLELSRQRLRPSLLETNFEKCPHCVGLGYVRATESTALSVLRGLEQEGIKNRGGDYLVKLPSKVALYILNNKRDMLFDIQKRYGLSAQFDDTAILTPSEFSIDRVKSRSRDDHDGPAVNLDAIMASSETSPDAMPFPIASNDTGERGESRDYQRRERSDRSNNERSDRSNNERSERSNNERNERSTGERTERNDRPERGERTDRGGERGNRRGGRNRPPRPLPSQDGTTPTPQDNDPNGNQIAEGVASSDTQSAVTTAQGDDQRPRRRGRRGGRRRGRGEAGEGQVQDNGNNSPDGNNNPDGHDGQNQVATEGNGQPVSAPRQHTPRQHTPRPPRPPRVEMPLSIHDIDTTPREHDTPRTAALYEVVNQEPDKPKGGWWRRLTGQQ